MDIMLAFGIISVVMGHNYVPPFLSLPAYSFHMALFFFISGYFFKPQYTLSEKLLWLKQKIYRLLIPFYLLNLVYLCIAHLLKLKGINIGSNTIYSFFVVSLVEVPLYQFYSPAWFVGQLFLVHTLAQILYFRNNKLFQMLVLGSVFVLTCFAIIQSNNYNSDILYRLIIRTLFGLSFYFLGFLFFTYENDLKQIFMKPISLIVLYVIYVYINNCFGPNTYELVWAKFNSSYFFTPILSSISAILILYIISNYISDRISDSGVIINIGRNTFSIMSFHLLFFFLVNYMFYKFKLIEKINLTKVYYHVESTWIIYAIAGILGPLLLAKTYKKICKLLFPKQVVKKFYLIASNLPENKKA